MVNFVLTEHAKKRCRRRQISLELIERAITNPERIEIDDLDPSLIHAIYSVPEKEFRSLRVIYNEAQEPVRIVTAFFDS
ncbi:MULTISPECIES: DUF4258 domain-containing protein [Thiorhodovibrio]|uniref:DUF4258 domain-containing protein n=1 Tax=Thiorhodovibrio TaxID=61593 RepID=UPI00389B2364